MEKLRFRQIHLDFHTSEHIPGVGLKFDKQQWQDKLLEARVNSIKRTSLVPKTIEGLVATGVEMPNRLAMSATA